MNTTSSNADNSTELLKTDSSIVPDCGQEAVYILAQTQLYTTDGSPFVVSNDSTLFRPTGETDGVRHGFGLEDEILHWRNEAFSGGEALFCNYTGNVLMLFNGVYPAGCNPIRLTQRALHGKF